jgi:hypothetical protein
MPDQELDALTRTRKWAHQRLLEERSKVYRSFIQMEDAAFTDGALKKKHKELIAIT